MDVAEGFEGFQEKVDADPKQVRTARDRRDVFESALGSDGDVIEIVRSGSLERRTQLRPVHDVDLIVVYDANEHPEWGNAGDSACDAVVHTGSRVSSLLGVSTGTHTRLVRQVNVADRNRSAKCFVDPPEQDDAFTVDVMPALRQPDGTLLIPNCGQRRWETADPEYLVREVARLEAEWALWVPTVRTLKSWRLSVPGKVKSLVMEVLALTCLPTTLDRPEALREFFTAAAVAVNAGVSDPAGYCGLIQHDLDVSTLRRELERARDLARQACAADRNGETDAALGIWQELFGEDFPAPAGSPKVPPLITVPAVTPRPVKDAPQG